MFDKTLLSELERLGLSRKESVVYLALLEHGSVGSSKIIEATELHGQFVYQALTSLEQRGLVAHAVVRGRKKFHATHPRTLVRVAEQQVHLAEQVVEQLQSLTLAPSPSTFEIYQGQEAFVAHEEELLRSAATKSELCVIGGQGDRFIELMGNAYGPYEFLRRKKEIYVRYLGSVEQADALKRAQADRFLFEARVLPTSFTGLVNTNIWPERVNLNTFGTPITSFVLSSNEVAKSYRGFFEALWTLAKK